MLKGVATVLSLLGASTAMAQSASPTAAPDGSVNSYLCTFAGKCGGAEQAAEPSIAAPATKGFRLAAPSAATAPAPTRAAPSRPAPMTATAAPSRAAPRSRGAETRVASRTVQPPAAGTRANLLLNFGYNSDQLTDGAKDRARAFATALMTPELRSKRFLIEGHTDARGTRSGNLDLSRRRAQSVADFLVQQGVQADRVEVKGYGPDRPLLHRSRTAEANRRVEAVLLS